MTGDQPDPRNRPRRRSRPGHRHPGPSTALLRHRLDANPRRVGSRLSSNRPHHVGNHLSNNTSLDSNPSPTASRGAVLQHHPPLPRATGRALSQNRNLAAHVPAEPGVRCAGSVR